MRQHNSDTSENKRFRRVARRAFTPAHVGSTSRGSKSDCPLAIFSESDERLWNRGRVSGDSSIDANTAGSQYSDRAEYGDDTAADDSQRYNSAAAVLRLNWGAYTSSARSG